MPKGPNGEWRPADPVACAVHVMKIATGEIEETYEAPPDTRRPKRDSGAGGRARAAAMTPEERSASAKRASSARWDAGAR